MQDNDRDTAALKSLLHALLNELGINNAETTTEPAKSPSKPDDNTTATDNPVAEEDTSVAVSVRDQRKEFQLLILRMFSVLMSRTRSTSGLPPPPPPPPQQSSSNLGQNQNDDGTAGTSGGYVCRAVASTLAEAGLHTHCLTIIKGTKN